MKSKLAIFSFICSLIVLFLWGFYYYIAEIGDIGSIGDSIIFGVLFLGSLIVFIVISFITSIMSLKTINKNKLEGKIYAKLALIISLISILFICFIILMVIILSTGNWNIW